LIAGLFLIYPYRGLILSRVDNFISPYKALFISKVENPDLSRTTEAPPIKEDVKPSVDSPEISQTDPSPIASDPVPTQTIRIVKKGDNLLRLTKKVYGYADDKLVEGVKQSNPRIKDINKILIGEEIIFPNLKEEE